MSKQLAATGIYSDGSTQDVTSAATWHSDNTTVASVADGGKATALNIGSATISASYGGVSGNTMMTVTAIELYKIRVTPSSPMITHGGSQQFSAVGIYTDGSTQDVSGSVTWHSNTPAVAGVNDSGLATSADSSGLGTAVITATLGAVSGTTTLTTSNLISTPNFVAFQGDPGHSGQMLWNRTLSFPSSPAWQVDLSAASSYPVIANGRVYALINAEEEQLVALDLASGNMVWGPIAIDTFTPGTGGITYDNGKIFVLNFNGVCHSTRLPVHRDGRLACLSSLSSNLRRSPPMECCSPKQWTPKRSR